MRSVFVVVESGSPSVCVSVCFMSEQKCVLLDWNVRGFNNSARRKVVRDLVTDTGCSIACLQETKMAAIDASVVQETLGGNFHRNFAILLATGTRGGALLAVDEDYYKISCAKHRSYSVTAKVEATTTVEEWCLTVVYGLQEDHDKILFLQESRALATVVSDHWLVVGDFNMILQPVDKSNNNLNRRLMGEFRSLVSDLELRELRLEGRKYTSSNDVTQTRIDRAFCTAEWECMQPNSTLQALSSMVSDHCLLLLVGRGAAQSYRGFRFESFWPNIQGFQETVSAAWNQTLVLTNPFLKLHTKLQWTASKLKKWAKSKIGNNKLLLRAAKQLIGIFDVVAEHRNLSPAERQFKKDLKARYLGMSAIEKLRLRQRSRLCIGEIVLSSGDWPEKEKLHSKVTVSRKNSTHPQGERGVHFNSFQLTFC